MTQAHKCQSDLRKTSDHKEQHLLKIIMSENYLKNNKPQSHSNTIVVEKRFNLCNNIFPGIICNIFRFQQHVLLFENMFCHQETTYQEEKLDSNIAVCKIPKVIVILKMNTNDHDAENESENITLPVSFFQNSIPYQ